MFQFEDTNISVSNVDGELNKYFINGDSYNTFISSQIVFKLGISDISSSYIEIFKGDIKNQNGIEQSKDIIQFNAQNILTNYNRTLSLPQITSAVFPSAPSNNIGKKIPVVIGDLS